MERYRGPPIFGCKNGRQCRSLLPLSAGFMNQNVSFVVLFSSNLSKW
jgi:hypothetical protein